jgi:hypothetical protein
LNFLPRRHSVISHTEPVLILSWFVVAFSAGEARGISLDTVAEVVKEALRIHD